MDERYIDLVGNATTTAVSIAYIDLEHLGSYTNYTISNDDKLLLLDDDDETKTKSLDNYWALLALVLVFGTAAGNILVCLAIAWERRLQNVTNYFLMSLAITDLMVAMLVMPLGILTLFKGK